MAPFTDQLACGHAGQRQNEGSARRDALQRLQQSILGKASPRKQFPITDLLGNEPV